LKSVAALASAERLAPAQVPPQHVLLALDGSIERRALRLILEGAGIPLEECPTKTAAVMACAAAAAGEPFTTIIVDGRVGCASAAELLAAARAGAPAGVQGVVLLDTAAKADFAQFREAGFDAYLLRPVRPRSVLARLGHDREACEEAPSPAAPERQLEFVAQPCVLLVEDNDINALLARRMLEKVGCRVWHSVNGHEAVDAFRRALSGGDRTFDLVLMDAHMPVLDGLEATRIIRELHTGKTTPPIVAVTANAFDEDRRRCLDAGMDDYLAKPFDRAALHRLLERWCGDLLADGDSRAA
jgi:CheY-like chemotaxis protein